MGWDGGKGDEEADHDGGQGVGCEDGGFGCFVPDQAVREVDGGWMRGEV